jgi:hypothetical protein
MKLRIACMKCLAVLGKEISTSARNLWSIAHCNRIKNLKSLKSNEDPPTKFKQLKKHFFK